ncbi:MAG: type II secretion system F family protein [Clostridia bacterium]|nr:type II secretion system F family protein [Clostridia bacterium]
MTSAVAAAAGLAAALLVRPALGVFEARRIRARLGVLEGDRARDLALAAKGALRRRALRRSAEAEAADLLDLAACLAASGFPARRALRGAAVFGGGLSWSVRRAAVVDELGGSFLEALESACAALGIPEGRSLVRALRSAETLGTPLARVLREEAERSRERRRMAVARAADALPFQLALVTTLFLLPSLLVVSLVPSVINFLARW